MEKTFYIVLQERTGSATWECNNSVQEMIVHTARLPGFHLMTNRSLPVAHARNAACQAFMGDVKDPDPWDTLVMIDADHVVPPNLVEKLSRHRLGVVAALAVARGSDRNFVCFFGRASNGEMRPLLEWEDGELVEGMVAGTGAIAIKRWVLWALHDRAPSWFRYIYGGFDLEPTDEMDFGYACHERGIHHYCDTSLWIPHASVRLATPEDWRRYVREHPHVRLQVPSSPPPGPPRAETLTGHEIREGIAREPGEGESKDPWEDVACLAPV